MEMMHAPQHRYRMDDHDRRTDKVFNETPAFIAAKKAGTCETLVVKAAGLAVTKAKSIFEADSTKGIFHGDLNADNIFFDDGKIKFSH
jgi:Ser/Thr protein kinase RdoA (MazF antagonist)